MLRPRDESAETAELADLCHVIATRCAQDCRYDQSDCGDFAQDFTLRVLVSCHVRALLEIPLCHRRALLARMARLDCIDLLRRMRRQEALKTVSLQRVNANGVRWNLEPVAPSADPAEIHALRSLHAALYAAIDSLRPSPRVVLRYYYLESLPIAEIASRTERTAIAVRQCLYACRQTLRTRLISWGRTQSCALEATHLHGSAAPRIVEPRYTEDD